jgi:AbrB family looped-hinge helix DNA binding protein
MPLTKVGPKYQVTIPKEAREAIGLDVGDFVETTVTKDGVLLRPKIVIDKDLDIKKRLEAAEAAIKAGRVLGPFTTASAAMRAVKRYARARRSH